MQITTIHRFLAAILLAGLFAVIGGAAFADNHLPALHQAALDGKTAVVENLIDNGADVNAKAIGGSTPLHLAAGAGQTEIALALVKAGASLFVRMNDEKTPLDIAIEKHGKDSTIALFLQGAMKDKRNKDRRKADELLRELE